jgi:[ribosomal protein S5]-alanine N-acetyltransferase
MSNEATPHPVPQLETPRLVLRALVPDDADDLFAYAADPDLAQYTLWSAHTTLEDSRQFIAWISGGSLACWAIVQPATGRVIGTSFLHSHHARHQRAEIAFNLAKASWGRGYATEAAQAVMRAGFTHYGLNRIEGTCMLGNVASARVMEKVGMRFEGILRQYVLAQGAFHDMKLYAILREDVQ